MDAARRERIVGSLAKLRVSVERGDVVVAFESIIDAFENMLEELEDDKAGE